MDGFKNDIDVTEARCANNSLYFPPFV